MPGVAEEGAAIADALRDVRGRGRGRGRGRVRVRVRVTLTLTLISVQLEPLEVSTRYLVWGSG